MDIASHGLWGGLAFGRKGKKFFWMAFFFGIAPDLFSFGIFFIHRILTGGFTFGGGRPDIHSIPSYVHSMYDITHSLVIFCIVFCIIWLFLKRPVYEMLAWPLHVVTDIFTHSKEFFPTPFLWPLSDFTFNGIPWSNPYIFFPNIALLIVEYTAWWAYKRKHNTS